MKSYTITCPTHGQMQLYGDGDIKCPMCEAEDSKVSPGEPHICPCDGTCVAKILDLESSNLAQKMALEAISNNEHLKTEQTLKYPTYCEYDDCACMKTIAKEALSPSSPNSITEAIGEAEKFLESLVKGPVPKKICEGCGEYHLLDSDYGLMRLYAEKILNRLRALGTKEGV